MAERRFQKGCKGCDLSLGRSKPRFGGARVLLPGDWVLNHYGGEEAFLGWLALQSRFHRTELAQLSGREARALGTNIQRVDLALRSYWRDTFHNDELERMYVAYFFKSPFDTPPTTWHLHLHLIPRTRDMGVCAWGRGAPSLYAAWRAPFLTKEWWFPTHYRLFDVQGHPINQQESLNLMAYLSARLS